MTLSALGDSAVVIGLGESVDPAMVARVQAVAAEITRHPPTGTIDVVPAFASVAVFFDAAHMPDVDALKIHLTGSVARADARILTTEQRTIEIPVCYDGEYGPDLDDVARRAQLSSSSVVAQHSGADYLVQAIGFVPGFPYLGGLPAALATPRLATPRANVPAGSVGIGGAQTGIYPFSTPGGWNIIGRTPRVLFDAERPEPALLRMGDHVKFHAISTEEFQRELAGRPSHRAASGPSSTEEPQLAGSSRGIQILRAGMHTTVQDLGRVGHRARGVPLSGAADPFALRLANLLVGNPENTAALEFTLVGDELKFLHDTVIALGGAQFGNFPLWQTIAIRAGASMKLGAARHGCRGYMAVAGGIDVATVLGSRSTYTRANFGGFAGRALRTGDVLPVPDVHRTVAGHWRIDPRILPKYSIAATVRIIRGAHAGDFNSRWLESNYSITSRSDRMGVRLQGEALSREKGSELLSSPVAPGTVQVPPDGQPIVLLADAQTIGGYPQLAQVISIDLPLVAQLRPGDSLRFQEISPAEARESIATQERTFALLREGLAQKLA